jgi:hypothetical protein
MPECTLPMHQQNHYAPVMYANTCNNTFNPCLQLIVSTTVGANNRCCTSLAQVLDGRRLKLVVDQSGTIKVWVLPQ